MTSASVAIDSTMMTIPIGPPFVMRSEKRPPPPPSSWARAGVATKARAMSTRAVMAMKRVLVMTVDHSLETPYGLPAA